jgi:general L-amino acid transport system substrate-binding protein
VDVLIRNTTWTSSRDGTEGLSFASTTFYDGQGMMVKADSEFETLGDLDGTTICVLSATTTELNLTAQLDAIGVDFEPLSLSSNEDIQPRFIRDQCQAWTSDKSQLAGLRANWPSGQGGPEGLRILDVTMSKEPLGPVTRDGDSDWFDAVNWAVIATIQAEEFGITSGNVDQIRDTTDDPEIQRFLGLEIETEEGQAPAPFDAGLDLPVDFAYQVIKQVGNYGEIYDQTVGPDTVLGLERGVNEIWTEGGLLYAPPYR